MVKFILSEEGIELNVLKHNKDGSPAHPLYLPKDLVPAVWE